MVGKPILLLLPPGHEDEEQSILDKVKRGERVEHFETVRRRKDGVLIDVSVTLSPIRDDNGRIVGASKIARDITSRKLQERQLAGYAEQIEDLYDNAPCGYHSLDAYGVIVFINQTELDWLGCRREDVEGMINFAEFLTPASKQIFAQSFPKFMAQGHIEDIEYELISKNGSRFFVSLSATAVKDSKGKFLRSRSILYNITELKRAQQALDRENQKNKHLLSTASDGIHILDEQGNVTEFSDSFARMLGYSHEETARLNVADWDVQIPQDQLLGLLQSLPDGGDTFETLHRRKDGSVIDVEINAKGIAIMGKRFLYASARDITERKQAERRRQETEERLFLATAHNGVGIWDWNLQNQDLVWDDSMFALYQMRRENFSGSIDDWIKSVHPDDLEYVNQAVQASIYGKKPYKTEFRVLWPNGEVRFIRAAAKVFYDAKGQPTRMLGTNIDISDLKTAEDRLKSALKEKEVLLKEVYHRVKNNLQVVSSLINLQARNSDEATNNLLRQSSDRIKSMALLHEKLYQSEDLAKIDFAGYVRSLVDNVMFSYGVNPDKIKVKFMIEDLPLDVDTAIPCGLIINELVSNALKYAFPGDCDGEIDISFTRCENEFNLQIKDNGIGFPPGEDMKKTSSLGLKLVNILAAQLSGSIVRLNRGGSLFSLSFPIVLPPLNGD